MPETRLAFVGRGVLHRRWTLTSPAGGIVPAFFERRDDDLADALAAFAPDVVVVFTPGELEPGLVAGLDGAAVAFLPDNVPLGGGDADPWLRPPTELWEDHVAQAPMLHGFDPAEYDRILATDPLVASVAPHLDVWRCPPLPVDDALFVDGERRPGRPRPLYLGASNEYRENFLVFPKHSYDLSHVAFGLAGDDLREALEQADVGIVLNEGRVARFDPTIALHLAAGHLVIAEPLAPTRGLEPGIDHLVARAPHELMRFIDQLAARPRAWEQVRVRGRAKAEAFRASRVWPRLMADLAVELRAPATV